MEDKKDLTVVKDKSKELVVFEDDMGFTGFEGVEDDAGSFTIPFLKVLNSDSPPRIEGTDDFIEGSKNGDFFNTVTEEIYDRAINLIVIYSERVFNEYKPSRGGYVGTHDRIEGERLIKNRDDWPYVNKLTGNNLVETQTLIVLNSDDIEAGPLVFPCAGTQLKEAKSFLSRAKMRMILKNGKKVKAPLYSSIYRFETKLEKNDKGVWWKIFKNSIKRVGNVPEEMKPFIASAFKLFQDEGVDYSKVKDEEAHEEMDFDTSIDDTQDGNGKATTPKSPF